MFRRARWCRWMALEPCGRSLAVMITPTVSSTAPARPSANPDRRSSRLYTCQPWSKGFTPESVRNDAPIRIGNWTPGNYNGKYFGKVTLAEALARSLNSVSAQLVMEVGPKTVVSTAHRLGIESNLTSNASLALGTSEVTLLELTDSFVPFANGGYKAPLHIIRRVTTNEGKVLYEYKSPAPNRVIDLRNVGMMNAMLRQTVESGTATKAKFGWPAAGKTGTSQNFRDAWFIGYTSNLTTGVWFGNDDGRPTKKITGGSLPAIAWKDFMVAAHKGVPVASLPGEYQLDQQVNDGNDILPSSGDPTVPASEGVPSAQLNPVRTHAAGRRWRPDWINPSGAPGECWQ